MNRYIHQLFLVIFLAASADLLGQNAANPVDIYSDKPHHFFLQVYKENESRNGNCGSPMQYIARTKGVAPSNLLLSWTFTYYDCDEKLRQYVIKIPVRYGKSISKSFSVPMSKMKTLMDGSVAALEVSPPNDFRIVGDTVILEDDPTSLAVTAISPSKGHQVKWHWRGEDNFKAEGVSVNVSPKKTTTYFLQAEQDSFFSVRKSITVHVNMKPTPPPDFVAEAPKMIMEGDEAIIKVRMPTPASGVKWNWFKNENEDSFGTGDSISVSPSKTTTYRLQGDLNGKKSIFKSVTVNVTRVPDPPTDFSVTGAGMIREGEKITLRVSTKSDVKGIRWQWMRNDEKELVSSGDSLVVSPTETTRYSLVATSYKKRSKPVYVTVKVKFRSRTPSISGKLKICKDAQQFETYRISGGRLGTGSVKWLWYEGNHTAGKFIGEGNSIKIKCPESTTTYYVRPDADTSVYKEFTLSVSEPSIMPNSVDAPDNLCPNETFMLSVNGGELMPGMKWVWYYAEEGKEGSHEFAEGSSVTTNVSVTTNFYVRAEGVVCEPSSAVKAMVHVISRPSNTGLISRIPLKGKWFRLQVKGAPDPSKYSIGWYENDCGEIRIGSGSSIELKGSPQGRKIYMRVEGRCDTLDCRDITLISERKWRERYGFLNLGLAGENVSSYSNGMITLGSKRIYIRAKFNLDEILYKTHVKKENPEPQYESDGFVLINYPDNLDTRYSFTNKVINKRTAYTLGVMLGTTGFRFYLGAGYGKRDLLEQVTIYNKVTGENLGNKWAQNTTESIRGGEGEAGLFIKIGGFNLMGGVSTIYSFSEKRYYTDYHAGIGFCFARKK